MLRALVSFQASNPDAQKMLPQTDQGPWECMQAITRDVTVLLASES